jgi:hypothetical protein
MLQVHFRHAEDPSEDTACTVPGDDWLHTALPSVSHFGGDVSNPTGQRVGILLPAGNVSTLLQVIPYIARSLNTHHTQGRFTARWDLGKLRFWGTLLIFKENSL